MRKLIRFLSRYKLESIVGPLFKLLEASFELVVPLIMASVIDTGIRNADSGYIYRMGGLLVLMGVLGLVCSLTAQYFAAKAAMGFGTELRSALFAHINSLSHSEIDRLGASSLITRMTSDVNQAQSGVNLVLRLFLRSPFIVVGAIIMAFMIDVRLTLIFLAATPLLALAIYYVMAKTIPAYKAIQNKLDHVSLITRENLSGVRVIRAFSKQEAEQERFQQAGEGLMNMQLAAGRISALMNPATFVIVNLAILALIWFGGFSVDGGRISQGELVALVNYMTQILTALVALANLIISFTRASASAIRINEVFAVSPSIHDSVQSMPAPVKGAPKVAFENVGLTYAGSSEEALSGISFSAMPGETIGIIGGTGSGKSTLVNLIPRFYEATSGSVKVDGQPVQNYPQAGLRGRIGMVPQKAVLFKGSLRDNMRWGKRDATDDEIYEALDIAQAREFVELREGGLDAEIEQGGRNLSGGQRQRLTIARALVGKPDILILDDSASALDFATDARLRRAIREKTQDMTVFIVSQRAGSIQHADRIVVLEDGHMAGLGRHEDLIENCEVYREICLSQLSESEVSAK
ncbi:MAG TPA: ABC transporter ATP-binding protein [Candidatus Faecaligallichristensenella faecipullorum]|nr:ABC transporter ATP-binding protein [Candidatus Faecaligallichristensenella faecipullorum]